MCAVFIDVRKSVVVIIAHYENQNISTLSKGEWEIITKSKQQIEAATFIRINNKNWKEPENYRYVMYFFLPIECVSLNNNNSIPSQSKMKTTIYLLYCYILKHLWNGILFRYCRFHFSKWLFFYCAFLSCEFARIHETNRFKNLQCWRLYNIHCFCSVNHYFSIVSIYLFFLVGIAMRLWFR